MEIFRNRTLVLSSMRMIFRSLILNKNEKLSIMGMRLFITFTLAVMYLIRLALLAALRNCLRKNCLLSNCTLSFHLPLTFWQSCLAAIQTGEIIFFQSKIDE